MLRSRRWANVGVALTFWESRGRLRIPWQKSVYRNGCSVLREIAVQVVARPWGRRDERVGAPNRGDADGADFLVWQRAADLGTPTGNTVPEPTAAICMIGASLGAAVMRGRGFTP